MKTKRVPGVELPVVSIHIQNLDIVICHKFFQDILDVT